MLKMIKINQNSQTINLSTSCTTNDFAMKYYDKHYNFLCKNAIEFLYSLRHAS